MLTIIHEVLLGKGRSRCHRDGRFAEIQEVEFTTWIITQGVLRGKDQIRKDYSIFNIGKVKDSMWCNKVTNGFFILK